MKKELFESNPILRLSFDFSLKIIEYCEKLELEKKYVFSRQILRSGTSIGANVMEAQNAESNADFIHKMKIAAKEAGETQYWLMLCDYAPTYPECKILIEKLEEINKILNSILTTSKR
ncbi:MAG: four helix bundle protein [Gloeobacteraceae cyanobacterium ES-bin-316]|nr:four helix bundle protein [Ferruginibacter sp.]